MRRELQVRQWRGAQRPTPAPHFSEQLASSSPSTWLQLSANRDAPAIARAAALSKLAEQPSRESVNNAAQWLRDSDPLVRGAAAEAFQAVAPAQRVDLLRPLVTDAVRAVRLQVAALLSGVDVARLADKGRKQLSNLFDEYTRALQATQDMPGNSVSLGLFYADRGDVTRAEAAYRSARPRGASRARPAACACPRLH